MRKPLQRSVCFGLRVLSIPGDSCRFVGSYPASSKTRQESTKIDKKRRRVKTQRCSDFSARVAGALVRH
jgi:hypothetical protein